MSALNPKHDHFARLLAADIPAPAAFEQAGYKPDKSNASKLARRPDIAARVGELRASAMAAEGVTEDRIIAGLAAIAFSNPRSYFDWGQDGVVVKDSARLTDAQAAAVIQVEMTTGPRGEKTIKVKLADRLRALETFGRYAKLERPAPEQHLHLHAPVESPRDIIVSRLMELDQRLHGTPALTPSVRV